MGKVRQDSYEINISTFWGFGESVIVEGNKHIKQKIKSIFLVFPYFSRVGALSGSSLPRQREVECEL